MANEIRATLNVIINKAATFFRDVINPGTVMYDLAGSGGGNPGEVTITEAAEVDISFGAITPTVVFIQNLDPTNFFQIGPKSGGVMINCMTIRPGKWAWVPLDTGVTLRAKADTADTKALIKGYA